MGEVYGCWIEDPSQQRVSYPLTKSPSSINMSNGGSVKMGEYIQHTCPDSLKFTPLPLDVEDTADLPTSMETTRSPSAMTLDASPKDVGSPAKNVGSLASSQ